MTFSVVVSFMFWLAGFGIVSWVLLLAIWLIVWTLASTILDSVRTVLDFEFCCRVFPLVVVVVIGLSFVWFRVVPYFLLFLWVWGIIF